MHCKSGSSVRIPFVVARGSGQVRVQGVVGDGRAGRVGVLLRGKTCVAGWGGTGDAGSVDDVFATQNPTDEEIAYLAAHLLRLAA